ncbi:SdpI family protein [Nocardia otitidiscaviarum]|nr:SdpI family protein [Nocardia otitidiscaviarum]
MTLGYAAGVFVVAMILFVLAAVAVVTGVLGLTGTLPGNRYFGVHTDEALATEEAFRLANRVAGPTSIGAGILLAAGGVVALVAGGLAAILVPVGTVVIAFLTLGAGANAAAQAIEGLTPAKEVGGCGSACGSCSLRDACEPAAH